MTDNETNLAKWTAFARSTDPEAVGHTLNELAGEIGRLRCVCSVAAGVVKAATTMIGDRKYVCGALNDVARDLENEGSKEDGK